MEDDPLGVLSTNTQEAAAHQGLGFNKAVRDAIWLSNIISTIDIRLVYLKSSVPSVTRAKLALILVLQIHTECRCPLKNSRRSTSVKSS